MKLLATGLLALAACSHALAAPNPGCEDDDTPFDAAKLRTRLAFLADPGLDGRAPGSDGDRIARAFIADKLRCLGVRPAGDHGGFEQAFTATNHLPSANVIGYVPGNDPEVGDEIIVVAAHHDHLGGGYLGANDNASGVVALLAVAQVIRQRLEPPRRTIVFATFGDEEDGMIGSSFYVAHAPEGLPIERVVQVVNLDMVGSYASKGYVAAMGTFAKLPARALIDPLLRKVPALHVGVGGVSRGSDFEPFCKLGIPYVFFWTPDARCYHETCDTLDRIDVPHMIAITRLAATLTGELADTELDLAGARKRLGCFGK